MTRLVCAVLVLAFSITGGAAKVTVKKEAYQGWPNCYRMSNGIIDLVATSDIGPRIIYLGFVGGPNQFHVFPETAGKMGGTEWNNYGGHRLWTSPERMPRSYAPDNSPIDVKVEEAMGRMILTEPTEPLTGIAKQMILEMSADKPSVKVTHRLRNDGQWPITCAVWCLSVMEKGGRTIVPFPRGDDPKQLLSNRGLVLWSYTDCQDPRLYLGRNYMWLQQDPNATGPIKIGLIRAKEGWVSYLNDSTLFVKRYDFEPNAEYPDHGCAVESYTNADFCEAETVGPLETFDTGQSIEHVERWYLLHVPTPVKTEHDVDTVIRPMVETETR
jgi:hypothetical protein